MTSIALPQLVTSVPSQRRWTVAEFERAWKQGVFNPDERLELIEGEILEKMARDSAHAAGIGAAEEALKRAFPSGFWVRIQMPLIVSDISAPEPDLAVVPGSWRDYREHHPTTAPLVVEVADSSLAYDLTTKASLYARADVGEYWIVNLVDHILEVHREPIPMTGRPYGCYYRTVTRYGASDSIAPLAAPNQALAVVDLLP